MRSKKTALLVCVCLLIAAFAGCSAGGGREAPDPAALDDANSPTVDMQSDAVSEIQIEPAQPEAPDTASTEPAAGTARHNFTLSYLIEDDNTPEAYLQKSAIFSLDLSEEWDYEARPFQVMLTQNGEIIGQIELLSRAEDISPLFSDIDAMGASTYSTKELTISGYRAKLYVLKSGEEGTEEAKPSYCFYIAPDSIPDAYVLIFFLPDAGTGDELETVASSFYIAHE